MPYRRQGAWLSAVLLVGVLVASSGAAAVASPRARHAPHARRVLIISLPAVVWDDLSSRYLPNLDGLFADSAVANLSTRAPSLRADLASGYATISAGDKAASG